MDPDIDFAGTQGQFDTFLHAARSYASLDGHAPLAVAGGDECLTVGAWFSSQRQRDNELEADRVRNVWFVED